MALEDALDDSVIGLAAQRIDWDAAYAEHLPRVYNFFRYRCSATDAEDLAAATFEKAWRRRSSYRDDLASLSTWILAIARNVAIDHLRAARPHAPLEDAAHVASGPTPEDAAVGRSDALRLAKLVGRLADQESDLVALKYGADMTNREIARVTGLSESNVGTILHRTVGRLREAWDHGD